MAKHSLGIYWLNHLLFCSQADQRLSKTFSIDIGKNALAEISSQESLQAVSAIQQALQQHKASSHQVFLALPYRDIIFRSFIIPLMQLLDAKSVIEFEVKKYIPFPLDELYYRYQMVRLVDQEEKKWRVVFVAVKKITLMYHLQLVEQAGLKVQSIEPAPVALMRALHARNFILKNKTTAILEVDEQGGKMIVVDHMLPIFVREFTLTPTQDLTNEIRISLNYLMRQESNLRTTHMLVICKSANQQLIQGLSQEFNVETQVLTPSMIIEEMRSSDLEFLHAYGATLWKKEKQGSDFNLLTETKSLSPAVPSETDEMRISARPVIAAFIVCLCVVLATFFLALQPFQKVKKEMAALADTIGPGQDISAKTLQEKNKELKEHTENLKSVRPKSNVSVLLAIVPNLLPEGVWVETFDIAYDDQTRRNTKEEGDVAGGLSVNLTGYAYHEDLQEQFTLADQFVRNLREEAKFNRYFKNIKLEVVKRETITDFNVTYFRIACQ